MNRLVHPQFYDSNPRLKASVLEYLERDYTREEVETIEKAVQQEIYVGDKVAGWHWCLIGLRKNGLYSLSKKCRSNVYQFLKSQYPQLQKEVIQIMRISGRKYCESLISQDKIRQIVQVIKKEDDQDYVMAAIDLIDQIISYHIGRRRTNIIAYRVYQENGCSAILAAILKMQNQQNIVKTLSIVFKHKTKFFSSNRDCSVIISLLRSQLLGPETQPMFISFFRGLRKQTTYGWCSLSEDENQYLTQLCLRYLNQRKLIPQSLQLLGLYASNYSMQQRKPINKEVTKILQQLVESKGLNHVSNLWVFMKCFAKGYCNRGIKILANKKILGKLLSKTRKYAKRKNVHQSFNSFLCFALSSDNQGLLEEKIKSKTLFQWYLDIWEARDDMPLRRLKELSNLLGISCQKKKGINNPLSKQFSSRTDLIEKYQEYYSRISAHGLHRAQLHQNILANYAVFEFQKVFKEDKNEMQE